MPRINALALLITSAANGEGQNQCRRVVFMGVVLQCRDVTAIVIAEDLTAVGEDSVGKFPHRRLPDVGCYPHFQ